MGNKEEEIEEMSIINQTDIKMKHLLQEKHLDILKYKKCLGASLVFNQSMTLFQRNNQGKFARIRIHLGHPAIATFNNSWKGLVMFLISVAALNYDKAFYSKYLDMHELRPDFKLRIDTIYSALNNKTDDYVREAYLEYSKVRVDHFMESLFRMTPDEKNTFWNQWRFVNDFKMMVFLKKKFESLPIDDKIEEVPVITTKRKIYVTDIADVKYEDRNVQSYIDFFVEMLDINLELSTVKTQFAPKQPYTIYPAKPVWTIEDFKRQWLYKN